MLEWWIGGVYLYAMMKGKISYSALLLPLTLSPLYPSLFLWGLRLYLRLTSSPGTFSHQGLVDATITSCHATPKRPNWLHTCHPYLCPDCNSGTVTLVRVAIIAGLVSWKLSRLLPWALQQASFSTPRGSFQNIMASHCSKPQQSFFK